MNIQRLSILFVTLCLSGLVSTNAQTVDRVLEKLPFKIGEHLSFLPSPSLSYRPETNLGFGVALIAAWNPHPNSTVGLSTAQLDLIYTLNQQAIADLDYEWRGSTGKWILTGSNSWYNYPEVYFSRKQDGTSEMISYRKLELENKFFRKISKNVYAGWLHRAQLVSDVKSDSDGWLQTEKPVGYEGGFAHGIGAGLLADTRGNSLNPEAGSSYGMVHITRFHEFLGSDFEFIRLESDLRHYYPLLKKHLLAIQFSGVFNSGQPPFRLSGNLGGSRILRGYHSSRHTGKQVIAAQAEARMRISHRWGGTLFIGAGSVAESTSDLLKNPFRGSAGIGIRFMLDTQNKSNLRLDIARGNEGFAFYFSYGEAF